MGTLFSQPERENKKVTIENIDNFLSAACELATKHKIEIRDVIAAKHTLEISRRNDLYVLNGNIFDEQLAGFGDILKDIHDALNDIAEK
jgi:hypothetical protein